MCPLAAPWAASDAATAASDAPLQCSVCCSTAVRDLVSCTTCGHAAEGAAAATHHHPVLFCSCCFLKHGLGASGTESVTSAGGSRWTLAVPVPPTGPHTFTPVAAGPRGSYVPCSRFGRCGRVLHIPSKRGLVPAGTSAGPPKAVPAGTHTPAQDTSTRGWGGDGKAAGKGRVFQPLARSTATSPSPAPVVTGGSGDGSPIEGRGAAIPGSPTVKRLMEGHAIKLAPNLRGLRLPTPRLASHPLAVGGTPSAARLSAPSTAAFSPPARAAAPPLGAVLPAAAMPEWLTPGRQAAAEETARRLALAAVTTPAAPPFRSVPSAQQSSSFTCPVRAAETTAAAAAATPAGDRATHFTVRPPSSPLATFDTVRYTPLRMMEAHEATLRPTKLFVDTDVSGWGGEDASEATMSPTACSTPSSTPSSGGARKFGAQPGGGGKATSLLDRVDMHGFACAECCTVMCTECMDATHAAAPVGCTPGYALHTLRHLSGKVQLPLTRWHLPAHTREAHTVCRRLPSKTHHRRLERANRGLRRTSSMSGMLGCGRLTRPQAAPDQHTRRENRFNLLRRLKDGFMRTFSPVPPKKRVVEFEDVSGYLTS